MQYKEVELSKIIDNELQPGWRIQPAKLMQLKTSIEKFGLLEPVTLINENEHYKLINGRRRKAVYEILKIKKIPAVIVDVDAKEGFITCNNTSKVIRRKDYTAIYLKGGMPPRMVVGDLIEITDKLGKGYLEEMVEKDYSAVAVCSYLEVADIIGVKHYLNFIAWGNKHRNNNLIKTMRKAIREDKRLARKVLTAFENDRPLRMTF